MKKFQNRPYFLIMILLIIGNYCTSQTDTIIDKRTYEIIERHDDGKSKLIGQFSTNCSDDTLRKHGYFIEFDEKGNKVSKKLCFFDEIRNRKLLGLKHGWWGWYGLTQKYFMGFKVTKPYLVDPCF